MIKKSWKLLVTSLLLISLASHAFAVSIPRSLPQDKRIKAVAYEPSNVVSVRGSTFNTTQILFNKNEVIETIESGDPGAWTTDVQTHLPYMLFIKPTIAGSKTNMMVVTNQHTYYFQLQSVSDKQVGTRNVTYAIHFIYPEAIKAKQLAKLHHHQQQQKGKLTISSDPSKYHWNYQFSGDKRLVPLHVFDDGQFTYFQLRPGQVIPAIFAVDNANGKESVVNFRREGGYLVVQQIAPQFTLRHGQAQVTSIFNQRLIRQEMVG